MGRLEAETVSMTFVSGQSQSFIWQACPTVRPAVLPNDWPEGWPYFLLPVPFYRLGHFRDSNCLVLRDEKRSVVIPCFEVFRALYTPHQEIALALLTGPWEITWPRVANPVHTLRRDEGDWQIGLRRRIRNIDAPILANLILSPFGKRAANGIHAALLEAAQRSATRDVPPDPLQETEDEQRSLVEDRSLIGLRAEIPFHWNRLRLTLRCISLSSSPRPKYLGFEIVRISWPPPPASPRTLWYYRDNSGTPAEDPTLSNRPRPFVSAGQALEVDEDGIVDVTSWDDPTGGDPQSEPFAAIGPVLEGAPHLREVPKEESYKYEGASRRGDVEPASSASPGNAGGAEPGVVRSQYVATPRRTPSHRFVEMIELLWRLQRTGLIEGWRVVRPLLAGVEFEGGVVGWPFLNRPDPKRAWCYIDRDEGRIRCAIVCEIALDGAIVHWLDLETREGTERFRAVLFRADVYEPAVIVEGLMQIAEQAEGVWPRPDAALAKKAGVDPIRTWKHWPEKGQPGRLSAGSAMDALRIVAYA